jgi:hypothetical protein
MRHIARVLGAAACAASVSLAGCNRATPLAPSPTNTTGIAGSYQLTRVDGVTPATPTERNRIQIVGAQLTLGLAAAQEYEITPGGPVPNACVSPYGDSAKVVDEANHTVTVLDGNVYPLPPCGNGSYTLTLDLRYLGKKYGAADATTTTTGEYAWGAAGYDDTLVTLVASNAIGTVTEPRATTHLSIRLGNPLGGPAQTGPQLEFDKE